MRQNGAVALRAGRAAQAIGGLRSLTGRSSRARSSLLATSEGINPVEAAEIDAMLGVVDANQLDLALRLSWRLRTLVQRSVPPRVIGAAPVPRAARLGFADGTTVLVKSAVPGDLGVLAVAMWRGSVNAAACTADPDGSTYLLFTWPGGHHGLSLQVVGLDQPD